MFLFLGYLFCFILISWGCLTCSTFFFFNGHASICWNYGGSPKIEDSIGKMECLPLWPTYIGEKGRTLVRQNMWEHPWGTYWEPREHDGKLLGTWRVKINVKKQCETSQKWNAHWPRHFVFWNAWWDFTLCNSKYIKKNLRGFSWERKKKQSLMWAIYWRKFQKKKKKKKKRKWSVFGGFSIVRSE